MPATAQHYGVADPYDPQANVIGGALYLKSLLDLFGHDLKLALAAYNAGEAAVMRNGGRIPPYAETQAYVPRVLKILRLLGETRVI
jgi:soluble lytic murein transglycosylase-like protein